MSGIGAIIADAWTAEHAHALGLLEQALKPYGKSRSTRLVNSSAGLAYTHFENTPESRFERQPLTDETSRFSLVFDGRLDNRAELARQLGETESATTDWPDSRFVLRSWQRHRENAVRLWRGSFAIIIWDSAEAVLWAAVDPLGSRTLCHARHNGQLVIASAPRAVLAGSGLPRTPNPQRLADTLADFYHDPESTSFAGVSRVPSGHLLRFAKGALTLSRYYTPPDPAQTIRYTKDEDYVEAGREILAAATRPLLRSSGGIGVLLSGGLDSPAVALAALPQIPDGGTLPSYTLAPAVNWDGAVPPGRYARENARLKDFYAMHPRLTPKIIAAPGDGFLDDLEQVFDLAGSIPRYPGLLAKFNAVYEAAASDGVTALLTGTAGNATLSWHGHGAYHHMLRTGHPLWFLRELWMGSDSVAAFLRRIVRHGPLPLLPQGVWDRLPGGGDRTVPPWKPYALINPGFARDMTIEMRARDFGFSYYRPQNVPSFTQRMTMLFSDTAREFGAWDQYVRARHGIECRDPFTDLRLIDWALRIPEEQYVRNGETRYLMRRILAGRTPQAIAWSRDNGMIYPDWYAQVSGGLPSIRAALDGMADDADVARTLDVPRISRLLDTWPDAAIERGDDPRINLAERGLVHALAVGRFIRWAKGANS